MKSADRHWQIKCAAGVIKKENNIINISKKERIYRERENEEESL